MSNFIEKQRGITLIALIITVIVLLILAGISINFAIGQNGVLNRAQGAKKSTNEATIYEKFALAVEAAITDGLGFVDLTGDENTEGSLAKVLKEELGEGYQYINDGTGRVVINGKTYIVGTNGTITELSNNASVDENADLTISTAEEFIELANSVNNGENFEGKIIQLRGNLDLSSEQWTPIGTSTNRFKGTFDGNNYTISGLDLNGWDMGLSYGSKNGLGLFAYIEDATIKNVKINNCVMEMEAVIMAPVAAYAYGDCLFDNIVISNTTVANYNWYTGGIVGWASGNQTYSNISIQNTTTISSLWGTYDCSVGGIIGGISNGANITFKNCNVSAKLDVFNDACSNYRYFAYRNCGMLIGNTNETTKNEEGTTIAAASNVIANNCVVTYGEWANYTYCEFESLGGSGEGDWKFKRVQEGYETEGVESEHTHDTDEEHEKLIKFDQLFGGATGVYGNPSHSGVNVIYNN